MTDILSAPLFLADNLALDFINSEYGVAEQQHDGFSDDRAVADWLQRAGIWPADAHPSSLDGLQAAACELRRCARAVIRSAMKGEGADLTALNEVLEAGRPRERLQWDADAQKYSLSLRPQAADPANLLWPVAAALQALLTGEKFEFVRECEASDCILLFHDLSKSHRRRWCSMATCGNRMKVAAFRARKNR